MHKNTSRATTTIANIRTHTSRVDGSVGDFGKAGNAAGAAAGGAVANN